MTTEPNEVKISKKESTGLTVLREIVGAFNTNLTQLQKTVNDLDSEITQLRKERQDHAGVESTNAHGTHTHETLESAGMKLLDKISEIEGRKQKFLTIINSIRQNIAAIKPIVMDLTQLQKIVDDLNSEMAQLRKERQDHAGVGSTNARDTLEQDEIKFQGKMSEIESRKQRFLTIMNSISQNTAAISSMTSAPRQANEKFAVTSNPSPATPTTAVSQFSSAKKLSNFFTHPISVGTAEQKTSQNAKGAIGASSVTPSVLSSSATSAQKVGAIAAQQETPAHGNNGDGGGRRRGGEEGRSRNRRNNR